MGHCVVKHLRYPFKSQYNSSHKTFIPTSKGLTFEENHASFQSSRGFGHSFNLCHVSVERPSGKGCLMFCVLELVWSPANSDKVYLPQSTIVLYAAFIQEGSGLMMPPLPKQRANRIIRQMYVSLTVFFYSFSNPCLGWIPKWSLLWCPHRIEWYRFLEQL